MDINKKWFIMMNCISGCNIYEVLLIDIYVISFPFEKNNVYIWKKCGILLYSYEMNTFYFQIRSTGNQCLHVLHLNGIMIYLLAEATDGSFQKDADVFELFLIAIGLEVRRKLTDWKFFTTDYIHQKRGEIDRCILRN